MRAPWPVLVAVVVVLASLPAGIALLHVRAVSGARAPAPLAAAPPATSSAPAAGVLHPTSSSHAFARLHRRVVPPVPRETTADWPSYGGTPNGTRAADPSAGVNETDVATLREAWRSPALGAVSGAPVVAEGGAFVGDLRGNVTRLALTDGSIVWQRAVGAPVSATLGVSGGRVFAVTLTNATLVALDARTGDELWSQPVAPTSAGWGSPLALDGLVIVGASGGDDGYAPSDHAGSVQAFDAATGALAWRTYLATAALPGSSVWTTPIAEGDLVVVGTGNPNGDQSTANALADSIVALWRANGTIAWSRQYEPTSAGDPIDDDFGSSPVAYATEDGERVVAEAQKYGALHVVDASSGRAISTSREITSVLIGSPAVSDGCLYLARDVTSSAGELQCMRASVDPSVVWSEPITPTYSSPAAIPGAVLVASEDGELAAYAASDGTLLWNATLPGQTDSSPVVADGLVLIGDQSVWSPSAVGGVVAFAPTTALAFCGAHTHDAVHATCAHT